MYSYFKGKRQELYVNNHWVVLFDTHTGEDLLVFDERV